MEHSLGWTPEQARSAIWNRQGGLCALCWKTMPPDQMEAHHRLRRALMPKPALWCCCNLVGLHMECHTQGPRAVHAHPEEARAAALILPTNADPREVPIQIEWPWWGQGFLLCNGDVGSPLA